MDIGRMERAEVEVYDAVDALIETVRTDATNPPAGHSSDIRAAFDLLAVSVETDQ